MRLIVSANGSGLDAPFSPLFGRCSHFVAVDLATFECTVLPNAAVTAAGGAGIQAAQSVIASGASAVITGQIGPNAHRVFDAAGIPVLLFVGGGTVREAVLAHNASTLIRASAATGPAHAGTAGPHGWTHGHGAGRPSRAVNSDDAPPAANVPMSVSDRSKGEAADAIRSEIAGLHSRLQELSDRLETLRREGRA